MQYCVSVEASLDGEDIHVKHLTTLNYDIVNYEGNYFTDLNLVKNFPSWHIC